MQFRSDYNTFKNSLNIPYFQLFIMTGPLSIPSTFSHALPHIHEAANLRILFAQGFDVQTADHDLLNKLVIYRFNQYRALNAEDYYL